MPGFSDQNLHLRATEWPHAELVPKDRLKAGRVTAQLAYGKDCSFILATRDAGYHSIPHVHDAEQLNYCLKGSCWVFVEDKGYFVEEGDVFRIPSGAVHWAWVTGDSELTVLEVHAPPLTGDPGVIEARVSLCASEEEDRAVRHICTEWPDGVDADRVEREFVGRAYSETQA